MIMNARKPIFVIKMCEEFEVPETKLLLSKDMEQFEWIAEPVRRSDPPAGLVRQILAKFAQVVDNNPGKGTTGGASFLSSGQTPASSEGAKKRNTGSPMDELNNAIEAKNWTKLVQVLNSNGKTMLEVAQRGCEAIAEHAMDNKECIELGDAGACGAVVACLGAFGKSNVEIAKQVRWWLVVLLTDPPTLQGLFAILRLAEHHDNWLKFGNAEAYEALVASVNEFGKSNEIVADRVRLLPFLVRKVPENPTLTELNERALLQGCEIICKLAVDNCHDQNRVRLGKAGACEALVGVLAAFGKYNERIARLVCLFVAIPCFGFVANISQRFV